MPYQRPAFWRVPHNRNDDEPRYRRVNIGTPAQKELLRGDIITKVNDYDARDLRHEDAQNLFRNAGNHIKLVVQRGTAHKHNYRGSYVGRCRTPTFRSTMASPDASRMPQSNGSSRCGSSMQAHSPLPPPYIPVPSSSTPYSVSPVNNSPGFQRYMTTPMSSLPHTVFPPENPFSPTPSYGYSQSLGPSPLPSSFGRRSPALFTPVNQFRDDSAEEVEAIANQPYRTTPLVLPGAKVKKDNGPTECYLRHHPNPAMRAAPHHDHDVFMKQKVAESILHRVGGEDATVKYAHKQFNSPIGLYSEANIVDTIKRDTNSGVPYKKTVLYNPAQSETFKALQEESFGDIVQEVAQPVQTKVFHAPTSKTAPVNKPTAPPPKPKNTYVSSNQYVSSLNDEPIHQSNSFKRLMYHVLGETDY